jgi:hypothetical protein
MAVNISPVDMNASDSGRLRNQLEKENAYGALNRRLLTSEMISKLRRSKAAELKLQAEETAARLRSTPGQSRQCKEVETLVSTLEDLRQRSLAAQTSHRKLLRSLLKSHETSLLTMARRHGETLRRLAASFDADCKAVASSYAELRRETCNDVERLQCEHHDLKRAADASHSAQCREIRDFWDEQCGVTRILGEERVSSVASALQTENDTFDAGTREFYRHQQQLQHSDTVDSAGVDSNEHRLKQLRKEITAWQQAIVEDEAAWHKAVEEARAVKSKALTEYTELQQHVGASRARHEQRMAAVSNSRYV